VYRSSRRKRNVRNTQVWSEIRQRKQNGNALV